MSTPAPDPDRTTPPGDPMQSIDPRTGLRLDKNGRRLCSARSRNTGLPCNSPAVTGHRVCRMHGAGSPQAKKKAALRLAELVDPAIATLAREMVQADSSADKQRAANSILDRAGVPRVTKEIAADDSRTILLTRLREIRESRPDGTLTIEQSAETLDFPASPDSPGETIDLSPEEGPHED